MGEVITGLLMGMCYMFGAILTLLLVVVLYSLLSRAWDLVLDWRDKRKRIKTIYLKRGK